MAKDFETILEHFGVELEREKILSEPPSFETMFTMIGEHMDRIPVEIENKGKKTVKMLDKLKPKDFLAFVKDAVLNGKEPMIVLNKR